MKQQPDHRKQADKRVHKDWAVTPALAANGKTPRIAIRLGKDEVFIPPGMAIFLADSLVDAVERNHTTIHLTPKKGKQ